jgi:hypothetical protein
MASKYCSLVVPKTSAEDALINALIKLRAYASGISALQVLLYFTYWDIA